MRRLRARLDRVEGDAHHTMSEARLAIDAAKDLIEDCADGITVEWTGKLKFFGWVVPVELSGVFRIDPREKESEK